jgi:hypothetical protein
MSTTIETFSDSLKDSFSSDSLHWHFLERRWIKSKASDGRFLLWLGRLAAGLFLLLLVRDDTEEEKPILG